MDPLELIPQRPPIVEVDSFESLGEQDCRTSLYIREDNIFCSEGLLREPGLVEHVAQSAAAMAGYGSFLQGEKPKIGLIGEVKKFSIHRLPKVGDTLQTSLHILGSAAGASLLKAEVRVGESLVAQGQMKIFIRE